MKLTICQCCKIFLLLTAFYFLSSLETVGLLVINVATTATPTPTITTKTTPTKNSTAVAPTTSASTSAATKQLTMVTTITTTATSAPAFVSVKPETIFTKSLKRNKRTWKVTTIKTTEQTVAKKQATAITTQTTAIQAKTATIPSAPTTTASTATEIKSKTSKAAETAIPTTTAVSPTQPTSTEFPQHILQDPTSVSASVASTNNVTSQHSMKVRKSGKLGSSKPTTRQRNAKNLQQQQKLQQQHVGVLLPEKILKNMQVQLGFEKFVEFFQVKLKNVSIDFLHDNDLSGFIKLLEHPKYSTIVRTLNVGTNADDDLAEGVSTKSSPQAEGSKTTRGYHVSEKQQNADSGEDDAVKQNQQQQQQQQQRHVADIGYCHLAEEFSQQYNKRVLMWPCSKMKESSNFLPSYEAISYAVQSIATKLNWTQVQIFVGDQNWGLPLAIAAHLHIPYTIEIGNKLRDLHTQDKFGKAIIITADMNDNSTLKLLHQLETLLYTKVLLIDRVATSFNAENRFYKNLAGIKTSSQLMSNLLLLTVLSDKYRHFLKVAFEDNGIDMVQNFRQLRRWRALHGVVDWPAHLDSALAAQALLDVVHDEHAGTSIPAVLHEFSDCMYLQHTEKINFLDICQNVQEIAQLCSSQKNVTQLRATLEHVCELQPPLTRERAHNHLNASHQQIAVLRNFIDFFNFYDFLISNILHGTPAAHVANDTPATTSANVAKYDFIVLDVVRGSGDTSSGSGTASSASVFIHTRKNNKRRQHVSTNKTSHNETLKWRPLLILEQHEINLNTYITHSILPGYDDWLLVSTAQLTKCGAICWTIVAIGVCVLFIIMAASVAAGIAMRNYFLRKRLSKGPNKIVLSASDFVFPVDSRRVDEGIEAMLCCWLQQLQEFGGPEVEKPDLLKGSIGSLKNLGLLIPGSTMPTAANGKNISGSGSLARHNPALLDMRARYNGDLVQLKEVGLNSSVELKSKAMDLLVMAHSLRHENVNPLIGWLSDPNRTAMVFDYCSRGSLQDVLIMDEIKLDWSFRLSLLTDLVRGMRYLHTSALRVHGALSSRNCVVDARWVLKITDYGLASFYEAQGLTQLPRSAKELLWTAPELLRSMKSNQHHHGGRVVGTQMGDVYSFGIIMQEVVVRGEPYCMLSLSAEEIIGKIKKPPPLIRPSVSKGAAPPEAINIMRQCWAEQPDMRPDFNSVYERFKMLNHGRKVNFVDTMFQMLEKYSNNLEELIRERTEQLDIERKKTEQLLNRMLPSSVAEKLKMGLAVDPEEFADVTIYFSDIVGFTTIAAHCSPVQVVDLLNDLYTIFDATINAYNVYKVETIGDAYMVVSGLPVKIPDHAEQIATMALDLLHQSGRFNVKHLPGVPLQLRIGLHTGPCCAGVVGLTMPRYCLFGDTVNTASRMESSGSSWRIHMSQETRDRLELRGGYMIEPRGLIDIKGKGMMNTFWLLGKKGFDKTLPAPPPIGLDESFLRNSNNVKSQANKSRTSTNPSSSQSSSLAGESVEVKVEITPPTNADMHSSNLPYSYSLDSNSTNTISPNMTLGPEFPTKTPSASPLSRKFSELTPDSMLNPNTFNRLPNSAGGSSSRLYKKIEELMDLSSPYNHYKCLSPSESNLTQFCEGKYLYSGMSVGSGPGSTSSGVSNIVHGGSAKFDSKPGSSRLLRRQFSLDRDDSHSRPDAHHLQIHQNSLQASHTLALSTKTGMLDIPLHHDTARSPKISMTRVVHKQNSNSIAQDLEKIEEIPLSPASSQHHSSLGSNLNRSPPSTLETQSPPLPTFAVLTPRTSPSPSAPTTPSVMIRSMNGLGGSMSPSPPPTIAVLTEHLSMDAGMESSASADASDTTTTATASVNSTNTTTPAEETGNNIRKPELTLNVEALMTR